MKETIETYSLAAIGAAGGVYKYYLKPELTSKRAWQAMALGILLYEFTCPEGELLSEGVDKALDAHPVLTRLAIGMTALHLVNALPPKIDILKISMDYIKQV